MSQQYKFSGFVNPFQLSSLSSEATFHKLHNYKSKHLKPILYPNFLSSPALCNLSQPFTMCQSTTKKSTNAANGNLVSNNDIQQNDSSAPDMWFVEYLTPHDAYHHGVRKLLHAQQTRYQSMTIADTGVYGRALFLDGKIQTTEQDEPFYHEPLVHAPCIAHGAPQNILILGGADGGAAREALRWKTARSVVVVDIDSEVVTACRKYLPNISRGAFDDKRCKLIIDDALDYIQYTQQKFDAIMCDLTDPMEDSPSLSLFTKEFFEQLQQKLTPNGAISIQAGPASLAESKTLLPRICATLSSVFPVVKPYQVFVPTYGSPLAMALATTDPTPFPSPNKIDQVFANKVKGSFHVLDGNSFHAHFAMPRCVQKAIANENQIYTLENTANAFGVGSLKQS